MSFEPRAWMSRPQEALCPHEATVPWAERSVTQQWCLVIHVTTHCPDTGEKIWQQLQPPICGDNDENRPQKQAKMLLTPGYMMMQRQWEKALIVILFLISFHLKIVLICECMCVCVHMHAQLPMTSLKQPHHRLKEMSPLSSLMYWRFSPQFNLLLPKYFHPF